MQVCIIRVCVNAVVVLGGQIINQSFNVAVNYANRSASGAMSTEALAGGSMIRSELVIGYWLQNACILTKPLSFA